MILAIYGRGGLGREIRELAMQINDVRMTWDEMLYIDDNYGGEPTDTAVMRFDVFRQHYTPAGCRIVIGVGEPAVRELLFQRVKEAGYRLATMVHPSCTVAQSCQLGEGCAVGHGAFLSVDVLIGENVLVQPMAGIGHDTVVGRSSVISSYVSLAGHCSVGEETYIGMSVPVKQGITIGAKTIIGMGAVVLRDIPDGVIAIGNPARPMKNNDSQRVFK